MYLKQKKLFNEISEHRLNNITTIEEANKYLIEVFIPKFNEKFALDYKNFESVYETSPSKKKINSTLAILTPRKNIKSKTECLVVKTFNGELFVTIGEKIYELRKLETHKKYSKDFDIVLVAKKEAHKYIPPMTHHWKLEAFKKQLEKAHTQHVYA